MRAVMIGAAIGGIAAAVALRRIGWETGNIERVPEIREVGRRAGAPSLCIDRAGLQRMLLDKIPPAYVRTGVRSLASTARPPSSKEAGVSKPIS